MCLFVVIGYILFFALMAHLSTQFTFAGSHTLAFWFLYAVVLLFLYVSYKVIQDLNKESINKILKEAEERARQEEERKKYM